MLVRRGGVPRGIGQLSPTRRRTNQLLKDLTCWPSGLRHGFRDMEIPPNLEIRVRFPARACQKEGRTPLLWHLRAAAPRHTTCGRSTLTIGHAECWTVRSTKAEENVVSPPWLPTLGDRMSSPSCAWNLAKKRSPHSKKKRNVAGRVRSLWDYGWNFHFHFTAPPSSRTDARHEDSTPRPRG